MKLHTLVPLCLLLVISVTRAPQTQQTEFSSTGVGVLAFCLLVACGPTLQSLHGDLQRRSIHDDALEIMTQNAGRSSVSHPIPYETQAPRLGRPPSRNPVCIIVTAGS